jgi:outer membrane protein TolC
MWWSSAWDAAVKRNLSLAARRSRLGSPAAFALEALRRAWPKLGRFGGERRPEGLRYRRAVTAVAQAFRPALIALALATPAHAQTPVPLERITFDEAIRRAIEKNPSSAIAVAGILRADALLTEARSTTRLQVTGNVTTTTLNRGVEFNGSTVTPQNQVAGSLDVRMPLYAPVRWARTAQAGDNQRVAEANRDEVRRQTALATADAYLAVIARRRVIEANVRARDTAKAHFEFARQLQEGGTGSRLNQLRAQQEVSTDEGLLEALRLALYQAQEALGVLIVADGPVDAVDEPTFAIPPDAAASATAAIGPGDKRPASPPPDLLQWRPDLRLFASQQQAAERVLRDSSKDRLPELEALFQPSTTDPSQFFLPQNSWRFLLQFNVPVFDSGFRKGLKTERQAALDISRANLMGGVTTATSEVRVAREAVASAERALVSRRAAASQAQQVVDIVNISFRAGAATNIEVIDAERGARDADFAVAVAEDTLRRARLDLLASIGRFP